MTAPSVSTAVMAHPDRKTMAEGVSARLDGAPIVWDEIGERWDTRRRTLQAADRTCDWHLMVQDDAIVPTNLLEHLPAILAAVPPNTWVSLYLGAQPFPAETRAVTKRADSRNASWITFKRVVWGVALVCPTADIDETIEVGDRLKDYRLEDKRLGTFVAGKRDGCWHTWPSLVDHTQGPSISADRSDGRHAYRVGDPADFDPTGPTVRHRK